MYRKLFAMSYLDTYLYNYFRIEKFCPLFTLLIYAIQVKCKKQHSPCSKAVDEQYVQIWTLDKMSELYEITR